jgi:hypothetical protein
VHIEKSFQKIVKIQKGLGYGALLMVGRRGPVGTPRQAMDKKTGSRGLPDGRVVDLAIVDRG